MNMQDWRERADAVLPGGGLGNYDPSFFVRKGRGARVWDEDGNAYVDFLIGSGPLILGHCHPEIMECVQRQLTEGTSFFVNNAAAVELAEEICRAVACAEQVCLVTTGGEAVMYAIRTARAFTGKDLVVKFEGGFHGMVPESLMSLAPSRLENFPRPVPDSPGLTESAESNMLIAPFNDESFIQSLLDEFEKRVAAVIVEPFQRIIPPAPGFLQLLREECDRRGILLIFDEIVTGFRFAYGGAQEAYGVVPDLCTLGKIIGGGFPIAAVAGKREFMLHFDREKAKAADYLIHMGTLSGNPVAAVAGLKTLEILRREGSYAKLKSIGRRAQDLFARRLDEAGVTHLVLGHPTVFDIVFTGRHVRDYRGWKQADKPLNTLFQTELLRNGVLKPENKIYTSLAFTDEDFELTDLAASKAAREVARVAGI